MHPSHQEVRCNRVAIETPVYRWKHTEAPSITDPLFEMAVARCLSATSAQASQLMEETESCLNVAMPNGVPKNS